MQQLTAVPREALTAGQVKALLNADALEVSAGADLLDGNLNFIADISDDLLGGQVEWHGLNRIHRSCSLSLSRKLTWGTDLVRPWQVLTDTATGTTAKVYVGVFSLITPDREIGDAPETYDVKGSDRLYLLDRGLGDSYTVDTVPVLQAVRQAFLDAGFPTSQVLLDGSASASVLPTPMTWPVTGGDGGAATWLRVVNELLAVVNYRGVWCDENGRFRSEPYASPADRPVEWAFDADDERTLVLEDRKVVEDIWRTPNRWIFVQRNLAGSPPPAPVVGAGMYVRNNMTDGPTSQNARGLVWPVTVEYDAADQAALVALGNRRVEADLRGTRELELSTGPFPLAGHFDIFTYNDAALSELVASSSFPGLFFPTPTTVKVQALSWSFDLTGDTVEWRMQVVS
jgi:hypothetical protein